MATERSWLSRCADALSRSLKLLLIVPLIRAYRRRTRTRLAWRLAGSHFATVFVSVLAVCLVGVIITVIASRVTTSTFDEAGFEAWNVVQIVEGFDGEQLSDQELSAIFKGVTLGQLSFNTQQSDITIQANAGRLFQHIERISLIAPDGNITASSDPALAGQTVEALASDASEVVRRTLTGDIETDFDGRYLIRDDGTLAGTSTVRNAAGEPIGVVLVEKSEKTLPQGIRFALLILGFVLQFGIILLVTVGLPAIPVGIVFGIRRARAISRPISNLANTADRFAGGERDARVPVESSDEIGELQRGFNSMADLLQSTMETETHQRARAEQALSANRDLIANVSHELRTPVALIRGHLEALETDPEAREAYLRIALRETDRLERLVDELFQLSRLEAHQFDFDIEPFDAGSAVRSALESLAEPAKREAGLTLIAEVAPSDLTALGDRLRFEQVLINLIRNAVRFTPEGGIILVSAARETGAIKVDVRDTGIGISPDDLPHVFDRFYRADRSRARAGGGAGLGLAIAKELIDAMGGSIGVESVLEEGTVFTLRLPIARSNPSNGRSSAPAGVSSSPAGYPQDRP